MVFNVFNVVNHFVTHASNAIYLFLLGQQFQCCCDEPLQTDIYYCIADLFLPLFILLYMCEPVFLVEDNFVDSYQKMGLYRRKSSWSFGELYELYFGNCCGECKCNVPSSS